MGEELKVESKSPSCAGTLCYETLSPVMLTF